MQIAVKHALRDTRVQLALGVVVSLGVVGLGWYVYRSYRARINEQAQFSFSMQLENLEALRQDPSVDKQMWESLERDFAKSYQEHASSDLAPFYCTSQAETAWKTGNHQEALGLMEKAVQQMGSSHPLYYLYKTKLQVMRLACEDNVIKEEGKRELQALAADIHNTNRGYAWYQLWHHAWVADNTAEAEEAFAKLSAQQGQGAQWREIAQAKIDFIA